MVHRAKLWGGKRWTHRGWKLYLDWSLDHLPWPRAGVIRNGDYVEFWAAIGPIGPDPVLSVAVDVPRPGRPA